MLARFHINEVENHEAANVAKPKLASHFLNSLKIHLKNRLLLRALALVVPSINVHCHKCFRLVNHEVATRLERNLAGKSLRKLTVKPVVRKDIRIAIVPANARLRPARNAACHFAHLFVALGIINHDSIHILGKPVANNALTKIRLLEYAARSAQALDIHLHFIPYGKKVSQVARKRTCARALTDRPNHKTNILRKRKPIENLLKALPLLGIANLLGDSAKRSSVRIFGSWHHHEIAPRNREVRHYTRTFRRNRPLRDLNNNLASWRKTLGDLRIGKTVGLALTLLRARIVIVIKRSIPVWSHIPVMEKRILLKANIHERSLKIVLQILNAPFKDAPHEPLLLAVLHHKLLKTPVLHNGNARFKTLYVHNYFALCL